MINKPLNINHLLHFLPFILWALYCIPDFVQPAVNKMNDFLEHFEPGIQNLQDVPWKNPDPMNLKDWVNLFLIIQLLIYILISLIEINTSFKKSGHSFFSSGIKPQSWLRDLTFIFLFIVIVVITVKLIYYKDIGDYLIASYISISIFITNVYIIRNSTFFQESVSLIIYEKRKYKKSSLDEIRKDEIVVKVNEVLINENYYKNNLASLPGLSKLTGIPVHHISQVINEKLEATFFELLARLRIEEAGKILKNEKNLTVEEVAEEVGYNSKSAFNKTFKKITGKTPSQFRFS
jgi:AraC-like DNA-binding protein